MILPKQLLEQMEYYEIRTIKNMDGFTTKIVLHFKQWWKPRKTLKFKWSFVEHKSEDVSIYKPTVDDVRLRLQLMNYFKGR